MAAPFGHSSLLQEYWHAGTQHAARAGLTANRLRSRQRSRSRSGSSADRAFDATRSPLWPAAFVTRRGLASPCQAPTALCTYLYILAFGASATRSPC
jgi:hypothetical protein